MTQTSKTTVMDIDAAHRVIADLHDPIAMPQPEVITLTAPITVEQLEQTEREHGLIGVVIETPGGVRIGEEGPSVGFILRNNFDDDFAGFVRFVNEAAA